MGKRRWAMLCGLVAATFVPLPIGASTTHAPSPATPTTFHAVDGVESRAVACASTTRCISAGATTLLTDDGGLTWRPAAQPITKRPGAPNDNQGPYLQTMACASTSLCLAAGYEYSSGFSSTIIDVWRSTDAGDTWSFAKALTTQYGLIRLTLGCPSATRCILNGDGVLETTTNGGLTWSEVSSTLRSVHCDRTLAARCTATDGKTPMYSSDSGASWHNATFPSNLWVTMAPVCPSATLCVASAHDSSNNRKFWSVRSTDGGHSYTATPLTGVAFGHDISCVSATNCVMFGIHFNQNRTAVARTTDGGKSWQPAAAPTPTAGQFVCTVQRCIFASALALTNPPSFVGPIATSEDVGLSWHTRRSSATADEFTVACPNGQHCIAAGGYGVSTSDDFGNSWTFRGGPGSGHSIACISATHCFMIAGSNGETGPGAAQTVLETLDGGATWNTQFVRDEGRASAVVCPSTTRCFAQFAASAVGETPYAQFDWSPPSGWHPVTDDSTPFHTSGLLVCVPGRCYGFDDGANIYSSSDQGATWTSLPPPYHTALSGFACVDALHCVGVGVQSTIYTPRFVRTSDGGKSWSYDTSPPIAAGGVRCNSAGRCLALGHGLAESRDGGATWTQLVVPGLANPADARCGGSNCVMVGDVTLRT